MRVLCLLGLLLAHAQVVDAGRSIIEVRTHSDFKKLLKHHKEKTGLPVIVDFFSVSCGPCQMIKPVYKRLADEFKGRAIFATVDVNENQQTSSAEGVRSMPTFKFYLNGKTYQQFSGADERQLRSLTSEVARKAAAMNVEVTKEELTAYYQKFDESKVDKVDEILAKYKHADLVKNLKAKYGKAPKTQRKKKWDPKAEKAKKEEALKGASLRKASEEELLAELARRQNDADEDEVEQMMAGPKAYKSQPNKLVVIGAGPAGLAAAVYAARAGLKPVVVAPVMGGQLMGKGVEVENFPGVEGSTGPKIVKQMRRQAFDFQTRFEFDQATRVDLSSRPFTISTNTSSFTAQSLVIATGADSRWLDVEGEFKYRGGGVSSCATCDGFLFKDQDVVVIGGGDSAMEDALVLARTSKSVTVVHRRDAFHRASYTLAQRVLENPKITVQWNRTVEAFQGGEATEDMPAMLSNVQVKDVVSGELDTIECAAAFVAIGHIPNTQLFDGQLEMDAQGYLSTQSGSTYTTVEGVFAAGDVADKVYRQAITSAGTGAMAALDAERWLSEHGLGVEEPGAEEDEPVMMEAEPVAEPEGADDLMAELLAEAQASSGDEDSGYPSHISQDEKIVAEETGADGEGDEELIVTDDSDL